VPDPLPIHLGQRGFGRPSHRNLLTPGRFEAPRRNGRGKIIRHRVGMDIDASIRHRASPYSCRNFDTRTLLVSRLVEPFRV
jgi:hypothetical protein